MSQTKWTIIITSSLDVKERKMSKNTRLKSSVKSKVWRCLTPSASRVPSIIVTMAMLLATTRHHGFL